VKGRCAMQQCPGCGKSSIKNITKLCLGPAKVIECKECGTKITVPLWTYLVFLAVVITMISLSTFTTGVLKWLLIIALCSGFYAWYLRYVPLIKHGKC